MRGVSSVGLHTTQLLVAMAGATLCATMFSGWLNGVIADMAAHRFAPGVDLARFAVRCQIAGEDLPVVEDGELTRQREHIEGAPAFVERVLLGNAEFERDEIGQLVLARRR